MTSDTALLFELLKSFVGTRDSLPEIASPVVWDGIFELASKQALVGVVFSVLERYPRTLYPEKKKLLGWWWAGAEQIKVRNEAMDATIPGIVRSFEERGFPATLLKGQGVARYYPHPVGRSPGDIDLWLSGDRRALTDMIRSRNPRGGICYHHGDYGLVGEFEVEVHFTPSWLYDPFLNRRLQTFFKEEARFATVEIGGADVSIPGKVFNGVYLLVHIYRHLFTEGIGLRQLLDYCMFLRSGLDAGERERVLWWLKRLHMVPFAKAVMYIMQQAFGLRPDDCLLEADDRRGRFLLDEVMLAGNFGQFDPRRSSVPHGRIGRVLWRICRNLSFFGQYPSEAFWSPFWKFWHYCWRRRNHYL